MPPGKVSGAKMVRTVGELDAAPSADVAPEHVVPADVRVVMAFGFRPIIARLAKHSAGN